MSTGHAQVLEHPKNAFVFCESSKTKRFLIVLGNAFLFCISGIKQGGYTKSIFDVLKAKVWKAHAPMPTLKMFLNASTISKAS